MWRVECFKLIAVIYFHLYQLPSKQFGDWKHYCVKLFTGNCGFLWTVMYTYRWVSAKNSFLRESCKQMWPSRCEILVSSMQCTYTMTDKVKFSARAWFNQLKLVSKKDVWHSYGPTRQVWLFLLQASPPQFWFSTHSDWEYCILSFQVFPHLSSSTESFFTLESWVEGLLSINKSIPMP